VFTLTGENFTEEFKYPIKIYRIWQLEFANGLEVRKLVFALFVGAFILLGFLVFGIQGETSLVRFFRDNWLVVLVLVPTVVTFIVFNMTYDHKRIIPFLRDRYWFYRTRHKQYEHFMEVATDQFETELVFEPFHRQQRGDNV
jgi:hypothetical protein